VEFSLLVWARELDPVVLRKPSSLHMLAEMEYASVLSRSLSGSRRPPWGVHGCL